ncbi:hypothetical protein GIB67_036952 [Kingdonia uniflora]|uniref:Uncharacterized protein n=1 Tax=Kingdonia uniflora TaxID=39325 RepID=A0A7J7NWG3_9MAGN|nr:hypothetical protein GIB67_036952 [Kingdonia uniflora]
MTGDESKLSHLEDIQGGNITFGDGSISLVVGKGKGEGLGTPKIDNILLVKGLKVNLLSFLPRVFWNHSLFYPLLVTLCSDLSSSRVWFVIVCIVGVGFCGHGYFLAGDWGVDWWYFVLENWGIVGVFEMEVSVDEASLLEHHPEFSVVFDDFLVRGWIGIMKPKLPCYPRLIRLFYASISNFRVHRADHLKAFDLDDVSSSVPPTVWSPILGQFPSKRKLEDSLLYVGKKRAPYVRRKNLSRGFCLFNMIPHRNILPQLRNKNVLVFDMLYLVNLYRQGHVLDLPNIMYEMLLTANPDHHTRALPFGSFISQLLIELGYAILEGEEVDRRDDVLNF